MRNNILSSFSFRWDGKSDVASKGIDASKIIKIDTRQIAGKTDNEYSYDEFLVTVWYRKNVAD